MSLSAVIAQSTTLGAFAALAASLPPERKHHRYSPSTLQALEACPGYQSDQNVTNERAIRGTYLHDCIEKFINTGVLDKGLEDDEVNVVESCAAFVREQMELMGPETELFMEMYLPIDDADTTAGYIDIGLVNRRTRKAKVIDWKTGLNPVEDTGNNLQGRAYELGLRYKFPDAFDECEVIFVMPFQGETGLVDPFIFEKEGAPAVHLRIATVVARGKAVTADFESQAIVHTWRARGIKPTNGTCLFCARKADCPALHEITLQVGRKYDPLLVPDVINPMLIKDAKEAGAAIKFFAVMEALAGAYRKKATERAMTEEKWMPEGYVVTTMTTRSVVNNEAFLLTIQDLLTPDQIVAAATFTLGKVEDAIKATAKPRCKAKAVEELGELLKMNGATKESEPIYQLRQKKKAKDDSTSTLTE